MSKKSRGAQSIKDTDAKYLPLAFKAFQAWAAELGDADPHQWVANPDLSMAWIAAVKVALKSGARNRA